MNSKILKVFLFSLLVLLPISTVKAASPRIEGTVYVAKTQIISGNLYASGQTITVNGTISGDLIVVTQNLVVNGEVEGDIIGVAQNITINGSVGGNIRIAGSNLTINGPVTRNVNAFGSNIIFGPNSHVGWDVYLIGQNVEMRGIINGSLSGRAGRALITGKIGRNLNLKLTNEGNKPALIISSSAIINGNVTYTAKNTANISKHAIIKGQTQQNNLPPQKTNWWLLYLWKEIFSIFSALIVGLILIFIAKKTTDKLLKKMTEPLIKTLLPGLLLMFIPPLVAVVLIFTLIGIPLSLIISSTWLIAVYIAKILTAILVGQIIIRSLNKKSNSSLFWPLVVGVSICWLIFSIPWVGWIIGLIAIWLGLGGIWNYVIKS